MVSFLERITLETTQTRVPFQNCWRGGQLLGSPIIEAKWIVKSLNKKLLFGF